MRSSALDPANAQRRQASPKRRVIPVVPKAAAAQARRGPKAPDALAAQVARYEQARALSATDPTAALAAYRAILNRWPKGVLAHEVELAILALHAKLGQREALRRAAAAFSRRYPTSPKRREVMRLLRRKK